MLKSWGMEGIPSYRHKGQFDFSLRFNVMSQEYNKKHETLTLLHLKCYLENQIIRTRF